MSTIANGSRPIDIFRARSAGRAKGWTFIPRAAWRALLHCVRHARKQWRLILNRGMTGTTPDCSTPSSVRGGTACLTLEMQRFGLILRRAAVVLEHHNGSNLSI